MKKTISVRVDEWFADDLNRMAKAQGMAQSLLIRQLLLQGVNNQNALATYITEEGEKTEKLLKRIESVVIGHLDLVVAGMVVKNSTSGEEVATAEAKAVFKAFTDKLVRGRKVSIQLDEVIAARAKGE